MSVNNPNVIYDKDIPVPVDIFSKERVPFNFLSSVCTKASGWVSLEESRHNASCLRRHIGWEVKGVAKNPLVHRVHVFIIERGQSSLQFTIQDVSNRIYK